MQSLAEETNQACAFLASFGQITDPPAFYTAPKRDRFYMAVI